jgi:hypothetical protein
VDFASILFLQYKVISLASNPSNLEDQVDVFISLSDKMVQLCPQALVSLFAVFDESQGEGGGILTRLHAWPSKITSHKY